MMIFVGINTPSTEFKSNTIDSRKMDQMVCHLCHSHLFSCEYFVLHPVSFTRFCQSNLYLYNFHRTGCSVRIVFLVSNDCLILSVLKILWHSSNDALVFSNDYPYERRKISSIQRTTTRTGVYRSILLISFEHLFK